MILEEFLNQDRGSYTYLVRSCDTAEAALIDPIESGIDAYTTRIAERGLKLVYVLQTGARTGTADAARTLRRIAGGRWVAPRGAAAPDADVRVQEGDKLKVGNLRVQVGRCPDDPTRTSYRVGDCFFRGDDVVVAGGGVVRVPDSQEAAAPEPEPASEQTGTPPAASEPEEEPTRLSDDELIERLVDETHRSLDELPLTPKEIRVLQAYLELMTRGQSRYPNAQELADALDGISKRDLHVQVHNIRRKQLDGARLPIILAGQITKWLKHIQDQPDYTTHEREFLTAYLHLMKELQRPPTGDEVADALRGRRSLQWVRKRVQTIRAKQQGYGKPPLLMSRRGGGISRARS